MEEAWKEIEVSYELTPTNVYGYQHYYAFWVPEDDQGVDEIGDDLISELLNGFIEEIEIRKIVSPLSTVRTNLGSLEELMASISEKGLLQPIIVRPVKDKFEVVAGMRRLEACRRLFMKKIPCHVAYLDEKEACEVSLIENIQRNTLDVIEEARAFKRYVDEYGYGSVSELARKIGKSEPHVSQRIAILSLPGEVQQKLIGGLITPSHAVELLGLSEREQELLSELIVKEKLCSKEVRRIKKRKVGRYGSNSPPFPPAYGNSITEQARSRTDRISRKSILLLRVTLIKLDDIIDKTDERTWMLKEILVTHRQTLHRQIDDLLRFRKKTEYSTWDLAKP